MGYQKRWIHVSMLVLLGWTDAAAQSGPEPEPLVTLKVEAELPTGSTKLVSNTTELRRGDKLRLELTPLRQVYLYVIHVGPSGEAALLYSAADKPLAKGQKVRLPAAGEAPYMLDDETGREALTVLATQTPLSSASPERAAAVRAVQEQGRLPPSGAFAAREPVAVRAKQRPEARVAGVNDMLGSMRGFKGAAGTIAAFPDASGVAVATLAFNHVH